MQRLLTEPEKDIQLLLQNDKKSRQEEEVRRVLIDRPWDQVGWRRPISEDATRFGLR